MRTTGLGVVAACPGAGKTLALADWASRRTASSWLTVEPEDRDPVHLWSRLLLALTATGLPGAEPLLSRLRQSQRVDRALVTGLVEAGRDLVAGHALILDDTHLLRGSAAMASLADLVQRRPLPFQLVLGTRSSLPLPLPRLRVEDRLTEVTTRDLAFRSREASELLARNGVELTADRLEVVVTRTEGWAAGLRLAALVLRDAGGRSDAVASFVGDERTIADYVEQEVLSRQPLQVRQFLLDTSVVRQVCAGLAQALTGRPDSAVMLSHLELENLFVVALDDRRAWFRYNTLFQSVLRQGLDRQGPGHRRDLHRRAAAWYLEHGELVEAGRQLAAAGAWPALAQHLVRSLGPFVLGHHRESVVQLVAALPPEVVVADPDAAAAAVMGAFARRDTAAMRVHVDRAGAALAGRAPRDRQVLQAVLATAAAVADDLDGQVDQQLQHAATAVQLLAPLTVEELPALPAYRVAAATMLADGYLWAGRFVRAQEVLADLMPLVPTVAAHAPVLAVRVHGSAALLRVVQGELGAADRSAQAALDAAGSSGWGTVPEAAAALVARAWVNLERAEQDACGDALDRARRCLQEERDPVVLAAQTLVRARLDLLRGRVLAARAVMRSGSWSGGRWTLPELLRRSAVAVQAEIELVDGHPRRAAELMMTLGPVEPDGDRLGGFQRVLLARAALLENRPDDVLRLLEPLRSGAAGDGVSSVDGWLLSALASYRLRLEAEARCSLRRALDLSAPERVALPFVAAGAAASALLRHLQEVETRYDEWSGRLITLVDPDLGGEAPPRLVEPLTNREADVLALLPSMMNNTEIAQELFLSVNTVKVHLKSLYRKLGVDNRRQAVRRAQQLGLGEQPTSRLRQDAAVPRASWRG